MSTGYSQDLYVFLPGGSPKKIEKSISGSTSLKVKAFKKVKALQKALKKKKDAYVIAPGALVANLKGYSVALKGENKGAAGEKYFIVASNPAVTKDQLAAKKVGVWNIFGRKNIKKIVKKHFGITLKKTKQVNKNEDLLTLLGIDMVDAILISESDLAEMKKTTEIKLLTVAESSTPLPYPVVAIPTGGDKGKVQSLSKVSAKFLNQFSFSKWSAK